MALARGPRSDPSPFSPGERGNDGSGGISGSTLPNDAGADHGRKEDRRGEAHKDAQPDEVKTETTGDDDEKRFAPQPPTAGPTATAPHRSTRDAPHAAPRKTPTAAQPTPTKARLPPMLHLPCLLTESD